METLKPIIEKFKKDPDSLTFIERVQVISLLEELQEWEPGSHLNGYVARDADSMLVMFSDKPTRGEAMWYGHNERILNPYTFSNLQWEDEPVEVRCLIVPDTIDRLEKHVNEALKGEVTQETIDKINEELSRGA